MQFLETLHPPLELRTVTLPLAFETQRQIAERGCDRDMADMKLARQTRRRFVQEVERTLGLAPLQIQPGLVNFSSGRIRRS